MTERLLDLDTIVNAAIELTSECGWECVSARSIARRLNCSTMPIYSQAGSMEELKRAVVARVDRMLVDEQRVPRTDDESLDLAVGYIAFARENPRLFRFLMETPRSVENPEIRGIPMVRELLDSIAEAGAQNDFLLRSWTFTHGLADLLASGTITMDTDEIIRHLRAAGGAFLHADRQGDRKEQTDG
jgi:AcrR family transcriptional regulator